MMHRAGPRWCGLDDERAASWAPPDDRDRIRCLRFVLSLQAPTFKSKDVQALFDAVKARDPDQPEFLQAVEEVLQTMEPVFEKDPKCAASLCPAQVILALLCAQAAYRLVHWVVTGSGLIA